MIISNFLQESNYNIHYVIDQSRSRTIENIAFACTRRLSIEDSYNCV